MAKTNTVKAAKNTSTKPVKVQKDTPEVSAAPPKVKGKKVKPVNLSVARVEATDKERKAAGMSKHVGEVAYGVNVAGVGNTRAKLFGFTVSSVWRWCGYNGWTLPDTLALRDGAGLNGWVTDQNVKCQFYDGMGRKAGRAPLYGGAVADLSKADAAAARKLAGLK
jgi:hypothetical protein